MNNKAHLRPKDFDSNGDIIPMSWKEEKGDRISREALKEAFKAWKTMDDYYHNTDCNDIPLSEVFDLIDNAPTVEIATKLQPNCNNLQQTQGGEWNKTIYGFYTCSICDAYGNPNFFKFCPNCGAYMRKGGAEE